MPVRSPRFNRPVRTLREFQQDQRSKQQNEVDKAFLRTPRGHRLIPRRQPVTSNNDVGGLGRTLFVPGSVEPVRRTFSTPRTDVIAGRVESLRSMSSTGRRINKVTNARQSRFNRSGITNAQLDPKTGNVIPNPTKKFSGNTGGRGSRVPIGTDIETVKSRFRLQDLRKRLRQS